MSTNAVPIGLAAFGENENDRSVVISYVSISILRVGTYVGLVCFIEIGNGVVGALLRIVALVVEQCHLKMLFACCLLYQCKALICVVVARSVPVHGKSGDAHAGSFINLAADYIQIMAGVADINVTRVSKPWHISREYLGTAFSFPLFKQGIYIVAAGQPNHAGEQ